MDDVFKLVINHILFNQICIFNIEYGVLRLALDVYYFASVKAKMHHNVTLCIALTPDKMVMHQMS